MIFGQVVGGSFQVFYIRCEVVVGKIIFVFF